jgi:hypothetical protein
MIDMFFKPDSHWPASRALIGRYGPWNAFKKTPTYNMYMRCLHNLG